jgi:SAM-dependent methyltransferase
MNSMDRDTWEEQYRNNENPWTIPEDALIKEVSDLQPGRFLDIGAGEGHNSIWMAKQGWDVTALDLSPSALSTARRLAKEQRVVIDTVAGDILEYRPDSLFDLVYVGYIHVAKDIRRKILEKSSSFTKEGGTLIYIGIPRGEGSDDGTIPPEDLATMDEVVRELKPMDIVRSYRDHVSMDFEWGPFETDIMVVVARKGGENGEERSL